MLLKSGEGKCSFFFFFLILFIYLFLAALGLHCCMWALSSRCEPGPLLVVVRGLLTAVASSAAEHRLQARAPAVVARGLSSRGSRALEHRLSSGSRA